MPAPAKFVQIAATSTDEGAVVFALDEAGVVWRLVDDEQPVKWGEISGERAHLTPGQGRG